MVAILSRLLCVNQLLSKIETPIQMKEDLSIVDNNLDASEIQLPGLVKEK